MAYFYKNNVKYSCILVAGGNSVRFNANSKKNTKNKVLCILSKNLTVLDFALFGFINDLNCEKIFLVYNQADADSFKKYQKYCQLVQGGKTRQQSVFNALKHVTSPYVLIHDASRPFLSNELVAKILAKLRDCDAVIPAIGLKNAIKRISCKNNEYYLQANIDRDQFKLIQTPQAFLTKDIYYCYVASQKNHGDNAVDDSSLWLTYLPQKSVSIVKGSWLNFKITYYSDLLYGRFLVSNNSVPLANLSKF